MNGLSDDVNRRSLPEFHSRRVESMARHMEHARVNFDPFENYFLERESGYSSYGSYREESGFSDNEVYIRIKK
ncbi:hypothetical protein POVCU2_0099020 [Plasmodium ovale curtisi]|uniref:Uncharacterized protein n=1 Tax=Plasmodium ovale curtisi TaxID=864141 RepID=A0A1A8WWU3_PLAOA|nr:hypothetical protein POVCU2_0099020 [Plasmodium ovale curtisi]